MSANCDTQARTWLPRRKRRRWKVAGSLTCLLVLLYIFRSPVLSAAALWLDVTEQPSPCEYVMVLGGCTDTRPFYAAALIRAGYAQSALVPAAVSDDESAAESVSANLVEQVLLHEGIPKSSVERLQQPCRSTFDEARSLAAFLRVHPNATVIVLTTDYHTRRARWIFRRELGDASTRVRYVGVPAEDFDAHNWWKSRDGFVMYFSEYVKCLYYWVHY